MISHGKDIKVFTGNSNPALAKEICQVIGTKLGESEVKTFADGDWSYVVDPPIVRDLPAETPVYAVTGSYTVTVTQGATVETYTSLVTLFDLLNALKTRSNMIEVDGVVVDDRTPGGMAAEDVPVSK